MAQRHAPARPGGLHVNIALFHALHYSGSMLRWADLVRTKALTVAPAAAPAATSATSQGPKVLSEAT